MVSTKAGGLEKRHCELPKTSSHVPNGVPSQRDRRDDRTLISVLLVMMIMVVVAVVNVRCGSNGRSLRCSSGRGLTRSARRARVASEMQVFGTAFRVLETGRV